MHYCPACIAAIQLPLRRTLLLLFVRRQYIAAIVYASLLLYHNRSIAGLH